MTPRAVRLALALVAGTTASTVAYAVLRVVAALRKPDPNPALVLWSEHAGYFWRAWTAVYVGGMVAFGGWLAAGRDAERTARVLVVGITIATVAIATQGLFVP